MRRKKWRRRERVLFLFAANLSWYGTFTVSPVRFFVLILTSNIRLKYDIFSFWLEIPVSYCRHVRSIVH